MLDQAYLNWYDLTCPACEAELEVNAGRWDGWLLCPCCSAELFFDFDMVVMQPDSEEWDVPSLRLLQLTDRKQDRQQFIAVAAMA